MKNTVKKYDLDKMIRVVSDRAEDYGDNAIRYEAKTKGDTSKDYEYGYGQTLDDVVTLLRELKQKS